MLSTARNRAAAALVCALAVVVVAGGPAQAKPAPHIPPDVAAVFAGDALRQAQAADEGLEADFSGPIRADDIHEVFVFTPEFVAGEPTAEPVTSNDTWIASIKRGDDVLGVLWVSKWPGEPTQWTGASPDVALATALGTVSATEILIDDAPSGSYYALAGTTARPLNDWARHTLPEPADVSDLQPLVAAQVAERVADEADVAGSAGLAFALGAMGVALAIAGALVLAQRRRRTRRGQSSTRHSPTTV